VIQIMNPATISSDKGLRSRTKPTRYHDGEHQMNTNTGMSETRELTDNELNTVSGGIIIVGGRPLREDALNPQPLPPVRGELLPAVQIWM
jgi:bacteriocin-like protein